MAVGSIDNKTRGNNSKNRYKNKRERYSKKEAIRELITELEYLSKLKEESIKVIPHKKKKKILFILPIAFILLIYLLSPQIKLLGDKEITINYNETYTEPGYKASFLFKNMTKKVTTKNNIEDNKIGTYRVTYYLKTKLFTIKRNRVVNIIDDIDPIITTDSDILKICPSIDNPEIDYKAYDEYDGDITNQVTKEYNDNKIILTVSDKSNNLFKTEIKVVKEDKESPKITLKGNSTIYLNVGTKYNEPGYEANDNCDGNITDKVSVSGSVGTNVGSYKVTYSVTDSSNNSEEVTRTIIVRSNNSYNSGTIGNGVIYLTFDDGPNSGTTNVILDILKEEGVKATFFVTCNGPDYLIKRIYDEGHTLALHTCTHDYSYVYSSIDNYFDDLNRVSNRVKNITGHDAKIIRFPGGSSNTISRRYQYGIMTTLTSMVLDKGYRYFDWNVDSNDAGGANTSSQVYYNVINSLSYNRSNVVLMHDIKYQTRDALRDIIRYAKNNGYTFSRIENDTYMVRHGVNN